MPVRSPIGAITNRFPGLKLRGGGQNQGSNNSKQPREARTSVSSAKQLRKVEQLVRDPVLWAEFKRRVAETNYFSNAGVHYILPELLDELDVPGLDLVDDEVSPQTAGRAQAVEQLWNGSGSINNKGFRLLQSLRTLTLDPPSPDISYASSPRSLFSAINCPGSPGSQTNLSPTKTPLTPMSANTVSTASTTPERDDDTVPVATRKRGPVPHFLEQPNF
jgi:hypothetical protein